jgi:pimeloyl-ACP methyl ester carboxylesterase
MQLESQVANRPPNRVNSIGRSAVVLLAAAIVLCPGLALAQERTSFSTQDDAVIYADLYGTGLRGVVLAHGGRFNKESWREQARVLVAAGFRVLAFDFRGYGQSRGSNRRRSPAEDARHLDVMAAVEYLRQTGASTVSVVGASMGGDYAAEAAEANPEKIDRLVLLAAGAYTPLTRSKARTLFIMSRDDVIGDNAPRLLRLALRELLAYSVGADNGRLGRPQGHVYPLTTARSEAHL